MLPVHSSAQHVLNATNSWLYAQTRNGPDRYDMDEGYVCTFSALVLKSTTAHLFHTGDARIYRLANLTLEQLTEDHRVWVSGDKSYLSRTLGMRENLENDYSTHTLDKGDSFILATAGVYEFAEATDMASLIGKNRNELNQAAEYIVSLALFQGSDDNLTIQIVRVDQLGSHDVQELQEQVLSLPFPPELNPRMLFDGYGIVREMHHSPRSHVYLAIDDETGEQVVLKAPSVDMRDNEAYLESFLMEEWVARRVKSAHLLQSRAQSRKRNYLYIVTEFVEEKTLRISFWVDEAIQKAVHPQPARRYSEMSEFLYDLRHLNPAFLRKQRPPHVERNPILFWKATSLMLFICTVVLLITHPYLDGS